MADFNSLLSGVLNTVGQSSQAMEQLSASLSKNSADIMRLGAANDGLGAQAIADAQEAAVKKTAADYAQAQVGQRAQTMLNLDLDKEGNALQLSTDALNAAQTDYKSARGEFDQLSQVGLLDNPMGYIMAQLKLPQVAARVNAASGAESAAEDNIRVRTQMLNQAQSTIHANTAGTLQEASLLAAQAEAGASQIKLNTQQMENQSRLAGIAMQQASLTDKQSDNKVKAFQIQMGAQENAMKREEMAMRRTEMNALSAERLRVAKERADGEDIVNGRLRTFGDFIGIPNMSITTIKGLPPKQQQAVQQAAMMGSLGPTLADSMEMLAALPGDRSGMLKTNPKLGPMIQGVTTATMKYKDAMNNPAADLKRGSKIPVREQATMAADEYAADVIASGERPNAPKPLSSPSWDNAFNPNKASHVDMLNEVAGGRLASLKDNVFVSALTTVATTLEPGMPFKAADEQRALKVIRDRVANRDLDPAVASAQISSYYRTASALNQDSYQPSLFGIPKPSSYYYTMEATGRAGKPLKANLFDAASVERALMADVRGVHQFDSYAPTSAVFGGGLLGNSRAVGGVAQQLAEMFGAKIQEGMKDLTVDQPLNVIGRNAGKP